MGRTRTAELRADADAVVGHADRRLLTCARRLEADPPAGLRELDRIGEQVLEDLQQPA
jgi:hypothetical protein